MQKGSGYLVETSLGKGKIYHCNEKVNGKSQVYLNDGKKILSDKFKVIGFFDAK